MIVTCVVRTPECSSAKIKCHSALSVKYCTSLCVLTLFLLFVYVVCVFALYCIVLNFLRGRLVYKDGLRVLCGVYVCI